MTTLAFVIPTWNRPEHLKRCVASIADQLKGGCYIHIVQDGQEPATTEAIAHITDYGRVPTIKVSHNEHSDYSAAFRAMFRAEPEADWVWTIGDDDLVRPGVVDFMLGYLDTAKADFIHVAETTRASGTNNLYHADTLYKLVNQFGLIEMTGFITGNVTRGSLLAAAAETKNWDRYAKTSFVQSLSILEALKDRPAMFMDMPLIETQDAAQTDATTEIWRAQDIPGRYLKVADAIEFMFNEGILTEKVRPEFFRYLSYHLWDRHLTSFISDFLNHGMMWSYDAWGKLMKLANFVADEQYAARLASDIEAARGMITLAYYLSENLHGLRTELHDMFVRRHQEIYPYSYMAKPGESAPAPAQAE